MSRVLIIEDEAIIAMLLGTVLKSLGHEVTSIEATEAGAVASATKTRPELMLVDDHLRAGRGSAAVARILQDGFIPHIMMSGDPPAGGPDTRGVASLRKPFTERELASAIAKVLPAGEQPAPSGR